MAPPVDFGMGAAGLDGSISGVYDDTGAAADDDDKIDDGAVAWPGNLDLAPDAMYAAIKARGEWVLT